ncbi:MAG: tRNA preQ1(34) S-adenosylmethionine ribosyltransferase-isomerase QueA [Candidatus Latescibacteria bacterium]|nr:tRNA preQ1(34) S-adenosylmethionine ribosyltransferase-isomerase QueA [Candidatus Latescibacterota bacterium]
MLVKEFDYNLPQEMIAQQPLEHREQSRLLMLQRYSGKISEIIFKDIIDYLKLGDLLVLNQTRVIPARIYGNLATTNKRVELLLLRNIKNNTWEALSRPARKLKVGVMVNFEGASAKIVERKESGVRIVEFSGKSVGELMSEQGEIALPPYIKSEVRDFERYQTVYAQNPGAIAAPTAGLHFTPELLDKIRAKGIEIEKIVLHAGLGTFRPVQVDTVEKHTMYYEEFEITDQNAQKINQVKQENRRIIACGTTVVRALESQAIINEQGMSQIKPMRGLTNLYIYPGYGFKIVDAMITNFHLPKSTLLMLVSAFSSKENIFNAYEYAIKNKFRFYSFGDAMFIY